MSFVNELLNRVTVNTHSSIRIETGGRVLYVDPFALTKATGDADIIFLTHSHFDHSLHGAHRQILRSGGLLAFCSRDFCQCRESLADQGFRERFNSCAEDGSG